MRPTKNIPDAKFSFLSLNSSGKRERMHHFFLNFLISLLAKHFSKLNYHHIKSTIAKDEDVPLKLFSKIYDISIEIEDYFIFIEIKTIKKSNYYKYKENREG